MEFGPKLLDAPPSFPRKWLFVGEEKEVLAHIRGHLGSDVNIVMVKPPKPLRWYESPIRRSRSELDRLQQTAGSLKKGNVFFLGNILEWEWKRAGQKKDIEASELPVARIARGFFVELLDIRLTREDIFVCAFVPSADVESVPFNLFRPRRFHKSNIGGTQPT